MAAAVLGSRFEAGSQLFVRFARGTDTLSVAEKVYSIAGFLAVVTIFLLVMSVQTVRLQTSYRHMHATSAEAAINVGRINAMSRGEIIGKTARELFSAEAAELIERRDRQLLAQKQQLEPIIDTIDNPTRGRRVISARRVQIGGVGEESHMFVTMVEDRTKKMVAAA